LTRVAKEEEKNSASSFTLLFEPLPTFQRFLFLFWKSQRRLLDLLSALGPESWARRREGESREQGKRI
jgi:hypothetical protein